MSAPTHSPLPHSPHTGERVSARNRQGACLPQCCRRWMNPVPGRPVKEEQKKSSCAATAERWINCEEDGINPQRQTDTCSHSTAPAAAAAHGCRCSHEESEPASARAPDGVLCGDGKTLDWPTRGGGQKRREERCTKRSATCSAEKKDEMMHKSTWGGDNRSEYFSADDNGRVWIPLV